MNLKLFPVCGLVPLIFLLASCDLILGVNNESTPLNTYDTMFAILRDKYAFQSEIPKSLDSIYERHIAKVRALANDNWHALAQVLQYAVDDIQDRHVSINLHDIGLKRNWPPQEVAGAEQESHPQNKKYKKFLEESQFPQLDDVVTVLGDPHGFVYGYVTEHKEIGYIQIAALFSDGGFAGAGRLSGNSWTDKIDDILKELKDRGVKTMLLDIRTEAGGSQYNPTVIAARFLQEEKIYMYSREPIGPADNPDNYNKITHRIGHIGESFTGKVIVLVNRLTGSGGEVFVLVARQRPNVTVLGTPTGGLPGMITSYDLPKAGWQITLTTSRTTGPDEKSYLRVGLPPDICVTDPIEKEGDQIDQILQDAINRAKAKDWEKKPCPKNY